MTNRGLAVKGRSYIHHDSSSYYEAVCRIVHVCPL